MAVYTTQAALNNYKRLEKLGEGTYGLVYKALDLTTNRLVALKKIKLDSNEEGIPATTIREVSLLSALKHQNIVEMMCSLYVDSELYLVFEFMSCDLKGYLDNLPANQSLNTRLLKKFTYFLIEGIRFCHSRRILHRDLKPQNILISDDNQLKIADFGLGREHGLPITKLTHEVVTLWYRSPEILLGQEKYSGACDVWSIGCIMAEMSTKVPLFPGDSEIDEIFQIYKILGTPTESEWPGISSLPNYCAQSPQWREKDLREEIDNHLDVQGINLLKSMLTYLPAKRVTCCKALLHEWFDEIRDEMIDCFGYCYPHCGSYQFQLSRFNKKQNKNIYNDNNNDINFDEDHDQNMKQNNPSNHSNNNNHNVLQAMSISNTNNRKRTRSMMENDSDDFDINEDNDITECHRNQRRNRNINNNNNNLSQPMDMTKT